MKLKAIRDFRDKESNMLLRKEGDVFDAKEERGKKLISLRLAEKQEEPDKTEKKETAK